MWTEGYSRTGKKHVGSCLSHLFTSVKPMPIFLGVEFYISLYCSIIFSSRARSINFLCNSPSDQVTSQAADILRISNMFSHAKGDGKVEKVEVALCIFLSLFVVLYTCSICTCSWLVNISFCLLTLWHDYLEDD